MTNNKLQIKTFTFGPFETNTYVVSDGQNVLLIDPACSNEYEQQELLDYINDRLRLKEQRPFTTFTERTKTDNDTADVNQSVSPKDGLSAQRSVSASGLSGAAGLTILATHAHLDHLWGAKWACEQWHTSVLMHPDDIPLANAMQQQYDLFGIRKTAPLIEYRPLTAFAERTKTDNDSANVNQSFSAAVFQRSGLCSFSPQDGLYILPTPGHTPGSVCLYFPEDKVLFSGDTLFRMGYGRTDLPGGDFNQLINSLQRLFRLPPDTRVFPGHGDPTTIAAEARHY